MKGSRPPPAIHGCAAGKQPPSPSNHGDVRKGKGSRQKTGRGGKKGKRHDPPPSTHSDRVLCQKGLPQAPPGTPDARNHLGVVFTQYLSCRDLFLKAHHPKSGFQPGFGSSVPPPLERQSTYFSLSSSPWHDFLAPSYSQPRRPTFIYVPVHSPPSLYVPFPRPFMSPSSWFSSSSSYVRVNQFSASRSVV